MPFFVLKHLYYVHDVYLPGKCLEAVCASFNFLISCFFFLIEGRLPPPVNLSLSWDQNSLYVNINWREPAGLDTKCKVNYILAIYKEVSHYSIVALPWQSKYECFISWSMLKFKCVQFLNPKPVLSSSAEMSSQK